MNNLLNSHHRTELFKLFVNDLLYLVETDSGEEYCFNRSEDCFKGTDIDLYVLRNWIRDSDKVSGLDINSGDIRAKYLLRSLGHKINPKIFLKYPKLCVLVSKRVIGDRWKVAEDSICNSSVACYLYSKYVINNRLPEKMHTSLFLRSFVEKDYAMNRYFREFG